MDEYRIRKLNFNNKDDFNLYIALKDLFLSEIKENNYDFTDTINFIQFESTIFAYKNKFGSYLPFFKSLLDVFVLEYLYDSTNENYKPIAYASISKKVYGKCNNWNLNPKETFELENFFVLPEYRLNPKTFELLKYAIENTIKENKKTVIFNVLSTNPNRYFHFALADYLMEINKLSNFNCNNNIYMYNLCCENANKILNMSTRELLSKAVQLQHEQTYENTEIPLSLLNDLDIETTL